VQQVAGALDTIRERNTRFEVSRARTDFLVNKAKQDYAYDNDPDYDTISERYSTSMQDILDSAAESIQDPWARQAFVDQARAQIAFGQERINQLAFGKFSDAEQASINESLEELVGAYGTNPNPEIINSVKERLQMAQEMGILSAVDEQRLFSNFQDRAFLTRFQSLSPAEKTEAINEDWFRNLPDNIQAQAKREAETALFNTEAQRLADQIIKLPPEQQIDALRELAVPLRDAVDKRLRNDRAVERRLETDDRFDTVQGIKGDIDRGGSLDDVPQSVLDKLTIAEYNSLEKYAEQEAQNTSPEVTPIRLYEQAYWAMKQGKTEMLKDILDTRGHEFSRKDLVEFTRAAIDGPDVAPPPTLDWKRFVKNRAMIEMDDENIDPVDMAKIENYVDSAITDLGRAPTRKELEEFTKSATVAITYDLGILSFERTDFFLTLPPAKQARVLDIIQNEDGEALERAYQLALQDRGSSLTLQDIMQAYSLMKVE